MRRRVRRRGRRRSPLGRRRRSLEMKEGRSLKTEERNGRRARARPSGGNTYHRRRRHGPDRARLQLGVVPAMQEP
jgi:hypothetical protein